MLFFQSQQLAYDNVHNISNNALLKRAYVIPESQLFESYSLGI